MKSDVERPNDDQTAEEHSLSSDVSQTAADDLTEVAPDPDSVPRAEASVPAEDDGAPLLDPDDSATLDDDIVVLVADDDLTGDSDSGPDSALTSSAVSGGRWPEIQAMFVDNPRASVELAAGVVDESIELLIVALKERQDVLQSAWSSADTDTEQLRTALQEYRAFSSRVGDFALNS